MIQNWGLTLCFFGIYPSYKVTLLSIILERWIIKIKGVDESVILHPHSFSQPSPSTHMTHCRVDYICIKIIEGIPGSILLYLCQVNTANYWACNYPFNLVKIYIDDLNPFNGIKACTRVVRSAFSILFNTCNIGHIEDGI